MSSFISYRMFLCSSAPWHAAIAIVRIKLLSLVLLLFSTTVLGKTANTEQAHIADTIHILPKTGLALYPLYEGLHDRLAVRYAYAVWQGKEGIRLPQYGLSEQRHSLYATGATRQQKWGAHGYAEYAHGQRTQVRSIAMAQPERFYPYIVLDTSKRALTREEYQLGGTLSYVWHDLGVGIGGSFAGTTQFGKKDPRPLARVGDFSTLLALSYRLSHYVLAVQGDYSYYSESFAQTNKKEDRQDYVYYHLGLGLYDHELSVQKRSESVKYIFAEYALTLQAAPQQRYLPLVQIAYNHNNAFGRTNLYTKIAETEEDKLQAKLFFPFIFSAQRLEVGVHVDYAQRTGYEIDYYTHQVNTSPNITEEREYHRVAAWKGIQSHYKAHLSYRYAMPSALFHLGYEGGLASLQTRHGQYYFEQRRSVQKIRTSYRRFYAHYDWLFCLQGLWTQPVQKRVLWARKARFFAQLQNSIERYYNEPHYGLQATFEGGYRITPAQRIAFALTGGFERIGGSSEPAWLWELALRYGFLNKR